MKLLVRSVNKEKKTFQENNIRLTTIGDLGSLPASSSRELRKAIEETAANTGLTLILALSYSSRWEIIEATKKLAHLILSQKLDPDRINSELFSTFLTTSSIPDPELLIRTSGEFRVSNFLLWQIAYTELYFTPTLWPDFTREEFYKAILNYQGRERRFGFTSEQIKSSKKKSTTTIG